MDHPVKLLIEAADRAITERDYERLMAFYAEDATLVVRPGLNASGKDQIRNAFVAISNHFGDKLAVRQGQMVIVEGGDTALVLMETFLDAPDDKGVHETTCRKATYVFRRHGTGSWLCVVDNSYGTDLIALT